MDRARYPFWHSVLCLLSPGLVRPWQREVRYFVYCAWPGETEPHPVRIVSGCLGIPGWDGFLYPPEAVAKVIQRVEEAAPGSVAGIVRVAPAEQARLERTPPPETDSVWIGPSLDRGGAEG